MVILLTFSFLAGIVTILSPCILPILPVILATSVTEPKNRTRPYGIIVGFVASFTFFTLFLSTIVKILGVPSNSLRAISVFVIAGFGLSLLIPQMQIIIERAFTSLSNSIPTTSNKSGFIGGFLIGLSLGLLWTPCVGPILASVISLAITGTVTTDTFLITLAYSLGTAIPMLLIILGGQALLMKVPWLLHNSGKVQRAFGLLMISTALLIYTGADRSFQTYIVNTFPQYGVGLTKLEDNKVVKSELEDMAKPEVQLARKGTLAPEIIAGGEWFNVPDSKQGRGLLTLKELRGKVVLIDFWTYSCINCLRTIPYLKEWDHKYRDKGLVIIGIHSPEFEFEKNPENVQKAIHDLGLTYPVMQDNNFATWKAYKNRYWPAKYFIDHEGNIRGSHFGEGDYDQSEAMIQQLLKEAGVEVTEETNNPEYQTYGRTRPI
jgi:cytochrome c biogenesis protein CcdA/thiol-disulfide isomerase/thioredoxin